MDGVKVMGFGKLEFGWVGQPNSNLPKPITFTLSMAQKVDF